MVGRVYQMIPKDKSSVRDDYRDQGEIKKSGFTSLHRPGIESIDWRGGVCVGAL